MGKHASAADTTRRIRDFRYGFFGVQREHHGRKVKLGGTYVAPRVLEHIQYGNTIRKFRYFQVKDVHTVQASE